MTKIFYPINIILFSDGGDGGDGAGVSAGDAGQQETGDLSNVVYGKQSDDAGQISVQINGQKRADEFKALIKGEYKDLYDAEVQGIIQKRFKATDEKVKQFEALSPVLDILYTKHGVKAGDIDALTKAIQEDDSYYEEEALEKGMSVETLKAVKKMERENAALKEQMSAKENREQADQLYAKWMEQAEKTKQVYGNFDLKTETQNSDFVQLLKSGVDVKTAFEVVHKDEILADAMRFASNETRDKLSASIRANGRRPSEGGIGGGVPTVVKADVTKLTKQDRAEIARRVRMGERISF